MPSLKLFGKRTCVAGDDLFVSSLLFLALRLVQLAVLIPLTIYASTNNTRTYNGCSDDDYRHDLLGQAYPIFVSYMAFSYVLVVLGVIVNVGLMRSTGKGTPTQPEKRKNVQRLCHTMLIPLSIVRILAITLGLLSVFILKDYCNCEPAPDAFQLLQDECSSLMTYRTYFLILVSTHVVEGIAVTCIIVYFILKCTPNPPPLADAQTQWRYCCHCCMGLLTITTCCCFGGRQVGDYSDIAMVLSDYFNNEGSLDIVPSDIVMALLMLLRVQEERRQECVDDVLMKAREYQETQRQVNNIDADVKEEIFHSARDIEEGMIIAEEFRFKDAREEVLSSDSDNDSIDSAVARLALAELNETRRHNQFILAESIVLQMNRTESTGKVYFRPEAREILMPTNANDRIAIAQGARFARYARAMYSWRMDLIEKPVRSCLNFGLQFFKSLYRRRNDKVVGDNLFGFNDASLESFAQIEPEQLVYASFTQGIGKIPFCVLVDHEWKSVVISIRGTLSLEDAVTDISLRPEPLEEVGSRCGFDGRLCYAHKGMLENSEWVYGELERLELLDDLLLNEDATYPDYKLVVTGHSLGAGCAAILSIMLKPKFPDVKGLCFSPPGCVLSRHLAESSKDFLTSYILDADIVPRLSQESMENLRDDVLEMIARIKVTKRHAVIASRGRGEESIDDLLYAKKSIPPSKFLDELTEFRKRYADRKEGRTMANVRLVPPGNLVHMVKTGFTTKAKHPCCGYGSNAAHNAYKARWIEASDLNEIIISAHLLDDHNPLNVLEELENIAKEEYDLSPPFTTL